MSDKRGMQNRTKFSAFAYWFASIFVAAEETRNDPYQSYQEVQCELVPYRYWLTIDKLPIVQTKNYNRICKMHTKAIN